MASQYPEYKRRPPPIEIPRAVPGPNAFAIAAKQDASDRRREDKPSQRQSPTRSSDNTPFPFPLRDGSGDATRLPPKSRSSAITTFASLMDQARGSSPRKSEHSSTVSRHGSTTRSRHSERSYLSAASRKGQLGGLGEENKTSRGELEAQSERKFFKMMGQIPQTPANPQSQSPERRVITNDMRDRSRDSEASRSEREEPMNKSPRKKFFGMSFPTFKSSANASTPPMPSKAAQILGSSPPKTRRFSPRPSKSGGDFAAPRSDTAKSLPAKLYNQHTHNRRPNHGGPSRSRVRASSRRSPPRELQSSSVNVGGSLEESSSEQAKPPTPPEKDTPPEGRMLSEGIPLSWYLRGPQSPEGPEEHEDLVDTGMKLHVPSVQKLDPIPSGGGESPTKFCPFDAEDHAKLIEGQRVFSAYGEVDYVTDEQDRNVGAPLETGGLDVAQTPEPKRWSEDRHIQRTPLSTRLRSSPVQLLQPTVYKPMKSPVRAVDDESSRKTAEDVAVFVFPPKSRPINSPENPSRGSIGVIFQGSATEIDPDSKVAQKINARLGEASRLPNDPGLATQVTQELRCDEQQALYTQNGQQSYLQPEQSSSRLTDMLSGVSPSRVDFTNEFQPNCPSAVPSPLNREPGQHHPMTLEMDAQGALGDLQVPQALANHFYMTNEHVDIACKAIWDSIKERGNLQTEQTRAFSSKQEQLSLLVEQQFEDIKLQIEKLSEKADHTYDQNHNINVQLDKLLEFIKAEIVAPLTSQSKKVTAMEQSIEELQKAFQELRQSEQKKTLAVGQPSPQRSQPTFALPNQRSQPSFPGFYDSSDAGRDSATRMTPAQSEMRRYGDQHWARPTHGQYSQHSRDANHPFSATNPYNNGVAQLGHGFMGGFPPYGYSPNTPEQHYPFNQGPHK